MGPIGCHLRHAADAANCSEGEITAFCSNATCYSALAGRCLRAVGSAGRCQKCAACAVAVAGQSGAAQQRCTAAQVEAEVHALALPPPAARRRGGGRRWFARSSASASASPRS